MNENLFIFSHCLKYHQIIHDTENYRYDRVYTPAGTRKNTRAPGSSHAANSLQL